MFSDMNSYIFRISVYDIEQKLVPKNIILIFAFSESKFDGCSHGSGIFVGNSNSTFFRFWSSVPLKRVFLGETPMTIKGRGVTTQDATTLMMSAFQSSKFVSCLMLNMCIKSSILRSFAVTPK